VNTKNFVTFGKVDHDIIISSNQSIFAFFDCWWFFAIFSRIYSYNTFFILFHQEM